MSGMDAAPGPTRTYLRRALRGWAGKGPAAKQQTNRSKPLHESRIPNPQSRPLRHPAPAPSVPVPANPDAPVA
ncbi:hypothetical protein XpiCFBP4643_07045 [Xanthomonas pisi]|uniref:Uncharacterized protein n=1 Tax=Xanthomonas pisi TaxID=56457 RepID=A0A2S7D630_9XANT|nr:hypothetical protein XpiCFBP4643_07045 [Xanthomonas pisi]